MNIGDRVRLLKGTEEGIITKFLDNKLVEVEIEDGFVIPVLKNELVQIAKQEEAVFGDITPTIEEAKKPKPKTSGIRGIFLGFIPINDQKLSMHFINNTDTELLFILAAKVGDSFEGYASGKVANRESQKITDTSRVKFDAWPTLFLQCLYYKPGLFDLVKPVEKKIKFKASQLFKELKPLPILDKNGYLYQVDANLKPESVDVEALALALNSNQKKDFAIENVKKEHIIDLHIEKLTPNYKHLSTLEILNFQLKSFENSLNKAIISGQDEIVFIHGIGNGLLKDNIHNKLATYSNLQFSEHHNIGKFGNGATLVRIQ